ncbi:unnamed protein product [Callosobruchus maculatus]|uniref:Uncharacterized protein n=1 Tax=Callosobruchus maculatus TaxID=64391 RepID=A0A653DE56_CALMS|nr:unnamed protein product [Callosobruchus maculatus]
MLWNHTLSDKALVLISLQNFRCVLQLNRWVILSEAIFIHT